MKTHRSATSIIVVTASIGVGVILILWHFAFESPKAVEAKTKKAQEHRNQLKSLRAANEMANRHNAVVHWEHSLTNREPYEKPYTIDLSRALIRSNNQPVLFFTVLSDISEKAGHLQAHFLCEDDEMKNGITLHLTLECTPEQVDRLTGTKKSLFREPRFSVVATIREVSPAKVAGQTVNEDEDAIDADDFIARGVCVDFQRTR